MEGAQAGAWEPPPGHGQGKLWGTQVHGGQVAEEGRVAGRRATWDLQD